MKNGDLVVVNEPGRHFHGYIGVYEDRGEGYQTVMVSNGCSKLSVDPENLVPYDFYTCGAVPFPDGKRMQHLYPDKGLKEPVRGLAEVKTVGQVLREHADGT